MRLTGDRRRSVMAQPGRMYFALAPAEGEHERFLSIDRPTTGESFDLLELSGTPAPGSHGEVFAALAQAGRNPSIAVIQGFMLRTDPPGLFFTLAVGLAQLEGPPPSPDAITDGDAVAVSFELGDGVRISRRREVALRTGHAAEPVATVQYLLATAFGGLGLSFSTPHVDGEDEFTQLFDKLAGSARIETA